MENCTQVLEDSFLHNNEYTDFGRVKVGLLIVKGVPYDILKGENVIGRDELSDIVIASNSISSKHAVIEVEDWDTHLVYDCGSTNKTRLGKIILKPNIRYSIQENDTLMFADIKAQYKKLDKPQAAQAELDSDSETGSETGSESMLNCDTMDVGINLNELENDPAILQKKEEALSTVQEDDINTVADDLNESSIVESKTKMCPTTSGIKVIDASIDESTDDEDDFFVLPSQTVKEFKLSKQEVLNNPSCHKVKDILTEDIFDPAIQIDVTKNKSYSCDESKDIFDLETQGDDIDMTDVNLMNNDCKKEEKGEICSQNIFDTKVNVSSRSLQKEENLQSLLEAETQGMDFNLSEFKKQSLPIKIINDLNNKCSDKFTNFNNTGIEKDEVIRRNNSGLSESSTVISAPEAFSSPQVCKSTTRNSEDISSELTQLNTRTLNEKRDDGSEAIPIKNLKSFQNRNGDKFFDESTQLNSSAPLQDIKEKGESSLEKISSVSKTIKNGLNSPPESVKTINYGSVTLSMHEVSTDQFCKETEKINCSTFENAVPQPVDAVKVALEFENALTQPVDVIKVASEFENSLTQPLDAVKVNSPNLNNLKSDKYSLFINPDELTEVNSTLKSKRQSPVEIVNEGNHLKSIHKAVKETVTIENKGFEAEETQININVHKKKHHITKSINAKVPIYNECSRSIELEETQLNTNLNFSSDKEKNTMECDFAGAETQPNCNVETNPEEDDSDNTDIDDDTDVAEKIFFKTNQANQINNQVPIVKDKIQIINNDIGFDETSRESDSILASVMSDIDEKDKYQHLANNKEEKDLKHKSLTVVSGTKAESDLKLSQEITKSVADMEICSTVGEGTYVSSYDSLRKLKNVRSETKNIHTPTVFSSNKQLKLINEVDEEQFVAQKSKGYNWSENKNLISDGLDQSIFLNEPCSSSTPFQQKIIKNNTNAYNKQVSLKTPPKQAAENCYESPVLPSTEELQEVADKTPESIRFTDSLKEEPQSLKRTSRTRKLSRKIIENLKLTEKDDSDSSKLSGVEGISCLDFPKHKTRKDQTKIRFTKQSPQKVIEPEINSKNVSHNFAGGNLDSNKQLESVKLKTLNINIESKLDVNNATTSESEQAQTSCRSSKNASKKNKHTKSKNVDTSESTKGDQTFSPDKNTSEQHIQNATSPKDIQTVTTVAQDLNSRKCVVDKLSDQLTSKRLRRNKKVVSNTRSPSKEIKTVTIVVKDINSSKKCVEAKVSNQSPSKRLRSNNKVDSNTDSPSKEIKTVTVEVQDLNSSKPCVMAKDSDQIPSKRLRNNTTKDSLVENSDQKNKEAKKGQKANSLEQSNPKRDKSENRIETNNHTTRSHDVTAKTISGNKSGEHAKKVLVVHEESTTSVNLKAVEENNSMPLPLSHERKCHYKQSLTGKSPEDSPLKTRCTSTSRRCIVSDKELKTCNESPSEVNERNKTLSRKPLKRNHSNEETNLETKCLTSLGYSNIDTAEAKDDVRFVKKSKRIGKNASKDILSTKIEKEVSIKIEKEVSKEISPEITGTKVTNAASNKNQQYNTEILDHREKSKREFLNEDKVQRDCIKEPEYAFKRKGRPRKTFEIDISKSTTEVQNNISIKTETMLKSRDKRKLNSNSFEECSSKKMSKNESEKKEATDNVIVNLEQTKTDQVCSTNSGRSRSQRKITKPAKFQDQDYDTASNLSGSNKSDSSSSLGCKQDISKESNDSKRNISHNENVVFPMPSTPSQKKSKKSDRIKAVKIPENKERSRSKSIDGEESRSRSRSSSNSSKNSQMDASVVSSPRRSIKKGEQVLFTGLNNPVFESHIKKLGGTVVDCVKGCSVLVTDKVRRTVKFLCVLGQGKPIVTPEWITKSWQCCCFNDPMNYILDDAEAEQKFSFKLSWTLQEARKSPLLKGYSVLATPSVKPPPEDISCIVESCGGVYLNKVPSKWPDHSVVISHPDDKANWKKLKVKGTMPPIVCAEMLLSGILQHRLDFDTHRIT